MKISIAIYFIPQCPWVFSTIDAVVKAAEGINASFIQHDLLRHPNPDFKTLFTVYVNNKPAPIGIGMSDVDAIKNILLSSFKGYFELKSEVIEYPETDVVMAPSKLEVYVKPISSKNIKDEIELCTGEDFLYGPMPQKYIKEAVESKKRWIDSLLKEIKPCGFIAYLEERPVGFIEFIHGALAQDVGMSTAHTPSQTCVILCLSVKKNFWRRSIGSRLLDEAKEHLRMIGYKHLEVWANKRGPWHPMNFYLKNGFKGIYEREEKVLMSYDLYC